MSKWCTRAACRRSKARVDVIIVRAWPDVLDLRAVGDVDRGKTSSGGVGVSELSLGAASNYGIEVGKAQFSSTLRRAKLYATTPSEPVAVRVVIGLAREERGPGAARVVGAEHIHGEESDHGVCVTAPGGTKHGLPARAPRLSYTKVREKRRGFSNAVFPGPASVFAQGRSPHDIIQNAPIAMPTSPV